MNWKSNSHERLPVQSAYCHQKDWQCPLEESLCITSNPAGQFKNILPKVPNRINGNKIQEIGEEDKDTQREKVKERRRRLEPPGSFQLNKVSRKAD